MGEQIEIFRTVAPGENVIEVGEDIQKGDVAGQEVVDRHLVGSGHDGGEYTTAATSLQG